MGDGWTKKNHNVNIYVRGKLALFTDPLSRVSGEKISYSIPTYSAIQGILRGIYSNYQIEWVIDECRVINPIKYEGISVFNPYKGGRDNKHGDLYTYQYLRDCVYQIKAHYEYNKNYPELKKTLRYAEHNNRLKKNLAYKRNKDLFFGCRECHAVIMNGSDYIKGYYDDVEYREFGPMFHSYQFPTSDDPYRYALIWNATMENGVIRFPRPEECTLRRKLFRENPRVLENNNPVFDGEDMNEP